MRAFVAFEPRSKIDFKKEALKMENEKNKSVVVGAMDQFVAFLSNSRALVAFAVGFLALAVTAKNEWFVCFDLIMAMSFAYRATSAIIAEVKAK